MMLTISLIMYGSVGADLGLGVLKQFMDFDFEMKYKKNLSVFVQNVNYTIISLVMDLADVCSVLNKFSILVLFLVVDGCIYVD